MNRRRFLNTSLPATMAGAALAVDSAPAAASQQSRRPSVLLISGWNLHNIGDVAITPGFLRLAQQHFPEARVTVLLASYFEEVGAYLKQRFPDIHLVKWNFTAGEALSPEMEEAFRGADLLVLNSGMTLSYGYYGLEWERYLPRLLAFLKAHQMGIPFGVYAHSFDKLEPHGEYLYRDVLGKAAFVYTRDGESLKLLKSKGVACPEMAYAPDATFGFDLRDQAKAAEILRAHSLEPGRFVSLIPRLDVDRFRQDGKEKDHAEQTRDVIVRYVRATKEPVFIVPEVSRLLALHREAVYDPLPDDVKSLVRYKADFWMPDEAQTVYAQSRMVVSWEMHSVILGLAAGTPSLHPFFRQAGLKQWMMRDLGVEQWLFDIDEKPPAAVAEAMIGVHRDTPAAKASAANAMAFARQRQRETMSVVKRAAMEHFNRR
ncbi:MAG: polysaccharide pyruvyl transferase family protein [Bryobacterales bacterium]|nr:polysaccharide pyruvyl transferase family protein [Bryobacterales bacterium]